ncbi:cupin domain-containing protein [Solihabitans fulvus]|uniref:Cupin domain-containing protein n=1 Tax=Solihabitans fulvus TaxID=1892852 RepID=A0A5B2WPI1_9PSEU|nr:cupin domain-containing protein [Solihabitans fulvus]KAA2252838.1 cupin domain-containing protein [Solihabitans fulvus]
MADRTRIFKAGGAVVPYHFATDVQGHRRFHWFHLPQHLRWFARQCRLNGWIMGIAQDFSAMPLLRAWDGVTVRVVHGELMSIAIAELEPNILVPEHQHVNEQLGVVIEGSAEFRSGGETVKLGVGGTYRFLANVPHEVQVGENGAVFVECFSPSREDWKSIPTAENTGVRWPPAK